MCMDWQELTRLTQGQEFLVERVRLVKSGIRLEGEFRLPPLTALSAEDQVFVAAFVRAHGSIKRMEELFGISYPTIKNRLRRLADALSFIEVREARPSEEVLDRLEGGEINLAEALKRLEERNDSKA